MRHGEFYDERLKCRVRQINKTRARKLYDQGKTIYLQSCKMVFNSMWQSACPINKERESWGEKGETFDSVVDAFTYFNCDNERGKYPCFFVEVGDFA